MALNAGDLDREIVIQTAQMIQSTSGEPVFDWDHAEEETIWAEWVERSAREVFKLQRVDSYIDGMFRIYDLEPRPSPESTRVIFDSRLYDVTGVIEIGRGEGLELTVIAHGEIP